MKEIVTKDGSITLYNEKFDDIYNSKSGAIEEATKKFIQPARIRELAKKGEVKILDIGFGLAYNFCAAIDAAVSENKNCNITIVSFEIDKQIIKEAAKINRYFKSSWLVKEIASCLTVGKEKEADKSKKEYKKKSIIKKAIKKDNCRIEIRKGNLRIKLIIGDAIKGIKEINERFNAVFLDGFKPKANIELWEAEFLKEIYGLMLPDSRLTTYSCSKRIRESLKKAGFEVYDGPAIGRKAPSTIAVKQ